MILLTFLFHREEDNVKSTVIILIAWGMVGPPRFPSGNIHPDG